MLTGEPFIRLSLPRCVALTSERGGYADAYGRFNACHYTGDDAGHVAECRSRLAGFLGVSTDRLVVPRQRHTSHVIAVNGTETAQAMDGVDGLVTDVPELVLCINTADCVPVLLVDPVAGIIGAVHSGWRGTVARISAGAVRVMERLGARPERIHAAMGPAICPRCFEVGEEVSRQFIAEFPDTCGVVIREKGAADHVDLGEAIRTTLADAGVPSGNISMPLACSHCPGSLFFSARHLGVNSGRTLTAVMLPATGHAVPRR